MPDHPDHVARIAALEADNRRLRKLLDQRDAPAELRHRLRSTMAMLRSIIRRTAETQRDFTSYVDHVEDRMDALMRAQAIIDERGSANMGDLLADELLHYGVADGDRADLAGPEIELQPRAGQVLALAFHELVINALEHGRLDEPSSGVEIGWTVSAKTPHAVLSLEWKERGGTAEVKPGPGGFGTEVLHHMLAYELNARTSLAFEHDGLRCKIELPFIEQVGCLADS